LLSKEKLFVCRQWLMGFLFVFSSILEPQWWRLQPLEIDKMPLAEPLPRSTRFGSPLVLSQVHWVRPEMVVEVTYAEWTPDGLLRHVVYLGERQDKLVTEVRRSRPHDGEP
jgi:ATP-dependent DNA ligase